MKFTYLIACMLLIVGCGGSSDITPSADSDEIADYMAKHPELVPEGGGLDAPEE